MFTAWRGTSGKEPACQCRRHKRLRFNPWVRKITWRRAWQPTPIFLRGESHGRGAWQATVHRVSKNQTGLSTHTHTHTHNLHIWRKWKNMKIQGPSFFLIKLSRKLFYMEVNPFVQTKWYACLKYFWNLIIKCLLEYGEKYLNRYITTLIVDFVIICLKVILNIYIL